MDPSSSGQAILLAVVVTLILISVFISLAETAFLNMSKGKLRFLVDTQVSKADKLTKLLEKQESVYRTMTVGNSLVNVAASALGATWINRNQPTSSEIYNILIGIAAMTVIILIIGEILPESIARRYPERISLMSLGLTWAFLFILHPFVVIFYGVSDIFLRLFGIKRSNEETGMTKEEFKNIVNGSVEEGLLDLEEKEIIENVTEFGLLRVSDIMTQRYDMVSIDVDTPYEEVVEMIRHEKYSRIPVYRDTTDDIVGILNVKDLLFTQNSPDFTLLNYVRPAYFTYEFKLVQELFQEMRRERTHIAVVLDEYGGTVGITTIEDFLEAIVGEIEDEYDEIPEKPICKISDSLYEMDGMMKLTDINDEMGFNIESEDVDTIGGFIIELLGNFPEEGQVIPWKNLEFTVTKTERNRVHRVQINVLSNYSKDSLENQDLTDYDN